MIERVTVLVGSFLSQKIRRVCGNGIACISALNPQAIARFLQWRDVDNPEQKGLTVWSAFPQDTRYFEPSSVPFMINYRVANLDWLTGATARRRHRRSHTKWREKNFTRVTFVDRSG